MRADVLALMRVIMTICPFVSITSSTIIGGRSVYRRLIETRRVGIEVGGPVQMPRGIALHA